MHEMQERLHAAIAHWNAGDLDAYLALYDPDMQLHCFGPAPMAKDEVAGFYRMIFDTLSPPGRMSPVLEIYDLIRDHAWLACHFRMAGAHSGAFMGIPASGRPYSVTGVTMLRFGPAMTVVERFSSLDMLGLMTQIGAVPAPG